MKNARARALLVAAAAATAAGLLATHRPGALVSHPDDPTSGVVGAAAWLAWALAGYLAVGVGAAAATRLPHRSVRPGALEPLAHLAPRCVRRLVDIAVGATAAAVVVAGAAPVAAFADPPRPSAAATAPLDWPSLGPVPAHPRPAEGTRPDRRTPTSGVTHVVPVPAPPPTVSLVSSPARRHTGPRAEIVVRAGDSLWTLAARQLGPGASAARIAAAWPRLYAANRAVIGTDPDLIHPGERLVPPAADPRSSR